MHAPMQPVLDPPSRQTLRRAVNIVATARGRAETARALRQLAAVAEAWAAELEREGRTAARPGRKRAA